MDSTDSSDTEAASDEPELEPTAAPPLECGCCGFCGSNKSDLELFLDKVGGTSCCNFPFPFLAQGSGFSFPSGGSRVNKVNISSDVLKANPAAAAAEPGTINCISSSSLNPTLSVLR